MQHRLMKIGLPWAGVLGTTIVAFLALSPVTAAHPTQDPYSQDEADALKAYLAAESHDPVADLNKRLESGTVHLRYDGERGYLPAVLNALGISPTTQLLVFSKTSFQAPRISPQRPRALYYNDRTFLGYVQDGEVLEVVTSDPNLGAVFYTLSQTPKANPRFVRQGMECIQCHSSPATQGVPGLLFRSLFVGTDGQPVLSMGSYLTRPDTKFEDRWGGWYVTGTHGTARHMGNVLVHGGENYETFDKEQGANITDLKPFLNTAPYLTPHSDIVALLVAEHQAHVLNLMAKAASEARAARQLDRAIHPELKDGELSDSSRARIRSVTEPLVRSLLFADQAALPPRITGTSGFAGRFSALGPRDHKGRSLREMDLNGRLFRYPCSYLVYSPLFDGLPAPVREYITTRVREILTSVTPVPGYTHLTPADKTAVREILEETKPEFAAKPTPVQPAG